ncbi:MAG: hypothetical protein L6R39_000089 [Caloplaca ligustica]|nr:MAG: hypothetical protein L6R39_000089 [Caloplaca ligustica]
MSRTSLPSLLSSLRLTPNLPPQSWYLVAGVTLSSLNRPNDIAHVFEYAIEKDGGSAASQLAIARRLRESLIKAAPIGGLPKSINALFALKRVTPQSLLDQPLEYSPTKRSLELYDVPTSRILQRGQTFFDQIYGAVSKRVMGQMDRSGTEDLGITARLMYGYVLSNTNLLNPAESSFVLIAGLIPEDGHLKGALNNGASVAEVRAVREVVVRLCEAYGMTRLGEDTATGWGCYSLEAQVYTDFGLAEALATAELVDKIMLIYDLLEQER